MLTARQTRETSCGVTGLAMVCREILHRSDLRGTYSCSQEADRKQPALFFEATGPARRIGTRHEPRKPRRPTLPGLF